MGGPHEPRRGRMVRRDPAARGDPELSQGPGRVVPERATAHSAPAGDEPLGEPGAGLRGLPDEPGRSLDRAARLRPGAGAGSAALARGRLRKRGARVLDPGDPRAQPRRDKTPRPEPDGRPHHQHGFRGDRGRHPADQPHAFSLFFPEKRTFFLQGADIFQFGLGLGEGLVPFFTRRIGLVEGQEVPILAGLKTTGRVGGTSVGALVVRTREEQDLAPAATMGALRLQHDLFEESSAGVLATFGDPLGALWELGARRRLPIPDLPIPGRQELPRGDLGPCHGAR